MKTIYELVECLAKLGYVCKLELNTDYKSWSERLEIHKFGGSILDPLFIPWEWTGSEEFGNQLAAR